LYNDDINPTIKEHTMGQLIIHPGTGTIVNTDECLVLDIDQLPEEFAIALIKGEDIDDKIVALAQEVGSPIHHEI
jgi:hypothetical protein